MSKNCIIVILLMLSLSFALIGKEKMNKSHIIHLVDSMLDETNTTMRNVEIEKTIELASKALALSSKAKYSKGMVMSYYTIGQALFHNQNYNEALSYLSLADKVKNHRKYPLYMTQIYKVKGQIYFYLEIEEQALREFNRALDVVKYVDRIDYKDYLTSQIYECFITIYRHLENKDEVLEYLRKNKALLETSNDETFIFPSKINMYSLIGEYYFLNNAPDSAMTYLDKAMSLINKYDFKYKSFTLRLIGDVLFSENNYKSALDYYLEALNNATELGIKGEYPLHSENVADTYLKINIPDSAAYYLNKKINAENDLLREKVSSTDRALKILIEEEKTNYKSKGKLILLLSILTTIIIGIVLSRMIWRKRHKEIIEEVEEETQQLKLQLNQAFEDVLELAKDNNSAFLVRFQEVYKEFFINLNKAHPELTTTDLKLCAMTYLNIPTSDIAKYTYVETRTVQTRRSRLRKKINLAPDVDLYLYLKSLG